MKKFIAIMGAFMFIVISLCLFSCSKDNLENDGFELVESITITTSGETKTFNSSGPIVELKEKYDYITKEEFDKAPNDRKYFGTDATGGGFYPDSLTKITVKEAVEKSKNSTYYGIVEEELEGYYYWTYSWSTNGRVYYTRYEYERTCFYFVYVKVKDDTTIVIRNGIPSQETIYTVTSYRIKKINL